MIKLLLIRKDIVCLEYYMIMMKNFDIDCSCSICLIYLSRIYFSVDYSIYIYIFVVELL